MTPCKYCDRPALERGSMCGACYYKHMVLPRFTKARDNLRVKCGLKPLAETTSDTNTCSNVD